MIDSTLMFRLLRALEAVDRLGMRETVLMDEVALAHPHYIEAATLREHLAEAERKAWVEKYAGPLCETRYRILAVGKAVLRDLIP